MRRLDLIPVFCKICILSSLLTGCVLFPRETPEATPTPETQQPVSETRARDWIQTSVADFETGDLAGLTIADADGGELQLAPGLQTGVYTSTTATADLTFNSIVAHWEADVPSGGLVRIEVRFYSAQVGWSAWHAFDDAALLPERARYYPETPLMLSEGQQFQYRATLSATAGQGLPALRAVTITYVDTAVGPTTIQAKAFARMGQSAKGVPQPAIISRQGWGADESYMDWPPEYEPSRKIVVHHTVTPNGYTEEQAAQWVRAIYYYHAVTLEWGDIGYNYLIDAYGNLYEGRYGGSDVVGGHVYSYNRGSTGIALIGTHGNYQDSVPAADAALSSLTALAAWEAARSLSHPLGMSPFLDAVTPNLGGHRDYPPHRTSCPGDDLYAQLPALRQSVWQRMSAYLFKYNVEWLPQAELPAPAVQAGQTFTVSIGVRNSGWLTWPHADAEHPVRLGYHWIGQDGQPVVQAPQDDHRTAIDRDVSFGDGYLFDSALVTAPGAPGKYTLVWDMVHEGIVWFHDAVADSALLSMAFEVVGQMPATPTPTATPDLQGLRNGGFESEEGWTIFNTSYPARYVGQPHRSGQRALQTGIEEPAANVYSYSSAEQTIVLPAMGEVVLRYWYQAQVVQGDYTYVFLRGGDQQWRPLSVNKDSTYAWTETVYDLKAYAGQTVTLRFGTFNDGRGGTSVMYVDDVSIGLGNGGSPTPSPTPSPSPTPTSEPTPTPLPTATATLTPTPMPTATPLPSCLELVVNGDFENDEGWTIANTPYRARYTDAISYAGNRSLQLGIADPSQDRFSYSSVEQRVAVPTGRQVTLRFWYRMPQSGGTGDYGYFLLRPDGGSWRTIRIIREGTGEWTPLEVAVSHYGGQTFTLRLGVRNDGLRDGATAVLYVDRVSVEACLP